MAEKRPREDQEDVTLPRKRKAISLALKKQIINLYESGYGPSFIARTLKFSISTISSILKDKVRIKEHLQGSTVSLDSAMITKRRSVAICEMERQLLNWIEKEAKMGKPQTQSSIQNKAYSIYNEIHTKFGDENTTFTASPGWFRRFKTRTKCNITEDSTPASKLGKPVDLVEKFWKKLFSDTEYDNKRIFKLVESDFYWKKLPSGACHISNDSDQQQFVSSDNEFINMLLCGNIAGDFKQKPLLIFPKKCDMFEDSDESNLPIYYRVSQEGRVDNEMFECWFKNYFVPDVEKYCADNNLSKKIVLVVNQSRWYEKVKDLSLSVKIIALPDENIEGQRSFDRFISLYFKAYYLQCLFVQAIEELEIAEYSEFKDFWKDYDISQAVYNIEKVWDEINFKFLSAMCTFDVVQVLLTSEAEKSEKIEEFLEEIVKLALELKLKLNRDSVMCFLDGVKNKKEKIIVVLNGVNKIVDVTKISDSQNIPPPSASAGFNTKELTTAFYEISSAMRRLQRMENDQKRFDCVKQKIQDALMVYRKMLEFNQNKKNENACKPSFLDVMK